MIRHYCESDIRRFAADYDTHGAVILRGFLATEALARLLQVVAAAIAAIDQPRTADAVSSSLLRRARPAWARPGITTCRPSPSREI